MNQQTSQTEQSSVRYDYSRLSEQDIYLFKEGNHFRMYEKLGPHLVNHDGVDGTYFAVWAPNAESVAVMGDFNGWNGASHPLTVRWDGSGIWEGFIPGVGKGTVYKYRIRSRYNSYTVDKGDPFARYWEISPNTASVVWSKKYEWSDQEWMSKRRANNALDAPWSVYELHLGSFRRVPEEGNRYMTYRELADVLVPYVKKMNFTHVEMLPVMEHPFYGSWGYQSVGYFAPSSRYGTPEDLKYLIDQLHQNDIGVIMDIVPAHFPMDEHGPIFFDGTHLYEHADPRRGYHPDWQSAIFNYGRNEVRNFLISSFLFWLDRYHVDGLRMDAVASMLYLDYSRKGDDWIPNQYGGRENLEAVALLKQFNQVVYENYPDVQTIAEESTAWPMVSRPVYLGGLGFGMKWNMGWMHDTLEFFTKDPIHRKYHHGTLTFSLLYAFTENFMLPLSHDEVVHGKGSLLNKMPGDHWQKMANLRLLLSYQYTHPGKKLLFMGGEFGQWNEWQHEQSLDWHLLDNPANEGLRRMVEDVNYMYRTEPALHEKDLSPEGFQWIDCNDWEGSVLSFIRHGHNPEDDLVVIANFTPLLRENYRVGLPEPGHWQERFNSDAGLYGGSQKGNFGGVRTRPIPMHGYYQSASITLPPLGVVVFKREE
ncbi:1,4-alpha-glucan branching protein GlgB [candidate division GN15 bacterium]|nr:1,4-alpha-glucan branching protein GlgB [candidate division GN15 bacterium]